MSPSVSALRNRAKRRKFFRMHPDFRLEGRPGYRVENEKTLTGGIGVLGPPLKRRGFPEYPELPRVLFDKKLGRPVRDLEQCSSYWLVSDRMKTVLETVDPEGCALVRCDVRLGDGTPGPLYWLCDVLRVLDALDETNSEVKIYDEPEGKSYDFMGGTRFFFKEDIIGSAHIFRMAYAQLEIICDQQTKDACKVGGLKGIRFRDAAEY